jgi:hypothetical protein
MIRGSGQGRECEVHRDSVLELLDQFPSPISPSSPVTPAIGCVSLVPFPPSSPGNTPTVPLALYSSNSDTSSKFNTYQRRSEMPLFSPLFQEPDALQEHGSHISHDERELVQFLVSDSLSSEHRALARSPSDISSSSQGGVSDIRPRSHWTAEEEALLDQYRCRSVQESNSDTCRVTRDRSIILYNPFATDEGDDEEDEEDLPIEALRKRLKLTSTLLPQSLETMSPVLNQTMETRAQATSTEGSGLAGIGCGPRNCSQSAFMPSHTGVGGSSGFSVSALSMTPPIVSRTFLGEYCPSAAPFPPDKANHDESTLNKWTKVPFKEYFPVNFELALGGTSRYPAFFRSLHSESQFTISPQAVSTNQPLDRRLAQSSPSVPSSNVPSPKLDNPSGYSQKISFPEHTLTSNSKPLRNSPDVEDVLGVKVASANIPSYLPGVFGPHEAGNTAENYVQTTDGSHNGLKRARRVLGASNWRPPTCWEMPGWEPAIELIGERGDQGHRVTVSPPLHRPEFSSGSVEPDPACASGSRAIFMLTPRPPLSSSSLSASKMSSDFGRSSRLAFIHSLTQQRRRPASRLPCRV